ncbi:TPM domain-containing protein [Leptospira sp. GIMC2001]|uniref:TPM domain-containing protein n=1 Tax=Leptospira sp. GIMC2001 TaxID=1513297 RepID=UPI00234AF8A0|nr:TPM domain-containing protein [Leptospira sp. GIMC2001]WCL48791.1 TPM domain-containing protein [Leptospira sp. GIMC2001]
MKRINHFSILIIILASGFVNLLSSQELVSIPQLTSRVVDNAGIISQANKSLLEDRLATLEREKGSQLVVLTLPSTQPETIEQFSIRVAQKWKIGRKGIDDGVLLIVAKEDRKVRIEVGYGLEGAIPDVIAKRILNEFILPSFRKGEFEQGILNGCEYIAKLIRGESLPAAKPSSDTGLVRGVNEDDQWIFHAIFMGVGILFGSFGILLNLGGSKRRTLILLLIAILLTSILSRLLNSWVMATFITGIISFITGIFMMIFSGKRPGLLANSGYSGGYESSGGFGGSSSGGGGGFSGGFSGGGGSFGGGGSSGSW